jgi:transcription elongation factor SPT5
VYIVTVPPDLWLIDPAFRGKKVVVEISGRTKGKWAEGEYDGLKGYVLSVFDPRTETTSRTAQFMPLHAKDKVMTVPIEYLLPVNPTAPQERVIIMDGEHKGDEVVVREESGPGNWTVNPPQVGSAFYNCPGDQMVRLQMDFGS